MLQEEWSNRTITIHQEVYNTLSLYIEDNGFEISEKGLIRLLLVYGKKVLDNEMYRSETLLAIDALDLKNANKSSDDKLDPPMVSVSIRTKNKFIINADHLFLYRCLLAAMYALDSEGEFLIDTSIDYSLINDYI